MKRILEPALTVAEAHEEQEAARPQQRSVLNVLDAASTGATQSFAASVDYGGRFLGVDVGSVRIGLALSDELGWMAHPLQTITTSPKSPQAIVELAEEHHVGTIVIGLPRNMNGTYGPAATHCREFAKKIEAITSIRIVLWDERLTTAAATRNLQEAGLKRKEQRSIIDQVAAQQILQDWMDAALRSSAVEVNS